MNKPFYYTYEDPTEDTVVLYIPMHDDFYFDEEYNYESIKNKDTRNARLNELNFEKLGF